MSTSLGDAIVNIGADTSNLTSALTGAQGSIGSFASGVLGQLGPVGAALGIAAGAALGVGVASVKMAGDFSSSVTSLVTGAGESVKNVDMIKQGLLDLSVQTATPTKNLVDGLYMIESAGYHGSQGLTVLKAAAEGAKVGNADLGTVSNALTTILTDYHLSADQATGATNALVQTVADGKTHMQDLASALGSVLPLASSLGISLPQVAGGLAVMTNAGMSAQRASANLANAIRSLAAPNSSAVKSMQAVGLTAQQLKDTLSTQGLTGAIQLVEEHVNSKFPAGSVQAVQAFKAIMGGATGYNVALMLGGKNMAAYEANVKNITSAMNSGKNGVQGWALVQQDFNFKLQQAGAAVNVAMIQIGTKLLPILSQLLSAVTPLITAFANWIAGGQGLSGAMGGINTVLSVTLPIFNALAAAGRIVWTFLVGLGADIGTVLQPAVFLLSMAWEQLIKSFQRLMVAFQPLAPTFILLAKIIGGIVVVALGLVIGVIAALATGLAYFLTGIITVISGIMQVFNGLITFIGGILEVLQGLFTGNDDLILKGFGDMAKGIESIVQGIGTVVVGLFTTIVGTIVGIVSGFITAVVSYFVTLYNELVGHSIIPDMVNAIVAWFASLPGKAISAVSSLLSGLGGFFSNLAGQALTWGRNIIQGFINGIGSMIGAVASAASNVVGTVTSFLGFHSPAKEGPGRDADTWAPNLLKMFNEGLQQGQPALQATLNTMLAPHVYPSGMPSGAFATAGSTTGGGSSQPLHISLHIDGHQVGQALVSDMRRKTGIRL